MTALVLLSGGVDSSTLLYWLRSTGWQTRAVAFLYGQRHHREVASAAAVADGADTVLDVVTLPRWCAPPQPVPEGHYTDAIMKATVVANRNMIFLAYAAGNAIDRGDGAIAYAAHSGDHVIYPDCRPDFCRALSTALSLGNWTPIQLVTPFLNWTKADIVRVGAALGVPFARTWSCYKGESRHCGRCGTCVERVEAFHLAGVPDPTEYE